MSTDFVRETPARPENANANQPMADQLQRSDLSDGINDRCVTIKDSNSGNQCANSKSMMQTLKYKRNEERSTSNNTRH